MASLFFSDSDNAAPLVRKEMRILQYLLWENIDTLNEKKGNGMTTKQRHGLVETKVHFL